MTHHTYKPQLIAWEVTRRCYLKCKHCRAAALDENYQGEFSTEEIKKTLDNIASFAKPIIILTGGEPMMRDDIYEIASYGNALGLRMVMAPCGRLVNSETVEKMKEAGIKRISLSIDGSTKETHDKFRGLDGSFNDVINAAKTAKASGMPFQINTTVTKSNVDELSNILKLAIKLGAVSFHPFLLVPTGRGKDLTGLELTPEEYENTLTKIGNMSSDAGIHVKPTCAPHYFRIKSVGAGSKPALTHKGHPHNLDSETRGCLGGTGFAFISHIGEVQICGFLDVKCGDARKSNYDFKNIWDTSEIFQKMRTPSSYKGKCGICDYHGICGGCRARAYAITGDYMKPEPYCIYIPNKKKLTDDEILTRLQDNFPIVENPFESLAKDFGITKDELIKKIEHWKETGLIRHLSAHINVNRLGFKSALVAISVADGEIPNATEVMKNHPGISHAYLREHKLNIWFTIKVPKGENLDEHVAKIAKLSHASEALILPSIKTFKLDVKFDAAKRKNVGSNTDTVGARRAVPLQQHLPPTDEAIVEALNLGLEISEHPFDSLANSLKTDEKNVRENILKLQEEKIIEKFRFVLNHNKLGVASNAMVVWDVEEGKIDEIGKLCAGKEFISHCYSRKRYDSFPYNLYTMIHAENATALEEIISALAKETGIKSFCKLVTKGELIKRKTSLATHLYKEWKKENV